MSVGTRSVDHKCPAGPERPDAATAPIWFYVQFSKPAGETADTGIEIRYTSGGQLFLFLRGDIRSFVDRRSHRCLCLLAGSHPDSNENRGRWSRLAPPRLASE
jgi:hypothetical protein